MLQLRLTIRTFLRRPTFTSINLLGLTISLASALLMLTYISYEWSFDRFHSDVDRIYRVINDRYQGGELIQHGTITYAPVGAQMDADFPEIDGRTRMFPYWDVPVEVDNHVFKEPIVLVVDTLFPELFDFPWIVGDPKDALREPLSVVLPANLVEKYFHIGPDAYAEAIGKTISIGDGQPFVVRGVMDRVPANSHLQFDMLISYETMVRMRGESVTSHWGSSDFWHYIRLSPGVTEAEVEAKLPAFSERHLHGSDVTGSDEVFSLQPLRDAHLFSDYEYEIGQTADGEMIQILLLVAIFVLIIAWINYINLSTTRAMERAREVGVRKVLGAQRRELIGQFLLEAVLFNGIALVLAFLLVEVVQPYVNQWLEVDMDLSDLLVAQFSGLPMMAWLALLVVAGMLLSGFYPAWVMSGYRPMTVLKGQLQHSVQGRWLRRGLVVFQFACSVGLVAATFTVYRQVQHMQAQDLGLELQQTVAIDGPSREGFDSTYIDRANQMIAAFERIPGVEVASTSRAIPGQSLGRAFDFRRRGQARDQALMVQHLDVDPNYLATYGIRLLAGRNFRPSDYSPNWDDLNKVLINQTLSQQLGFDRPAEAVGKLVTFSEKDWEVIGVTANFHQVGLQHAIEPTILRPSYSTAGYFSVRIRSRAPQQVLANLERSYQEFFPNNAFAYQFIEDSFRAQYLSEQRMGQLFGGFAGLALLIGCLGLLGLAAYSAIQRSKEIGIRKVLGASLANLLSLLGRELVALVLVASLIGLPLTAWAMEQWLQDFAYRIDQSVGLLVLPALAVLLLALASVAYQTWQTATLNPIEALRDE